MDAQKQEALEISPARLIKVAEQELVHCVLAIFEACDPAIVDTLVHVVKNL